MEVVKVIGVRGCINFFLRLVVGFLIIDFWIDFKGLGFFLIYVKLWVYVFFLEAKGGCWFLLNF